MAQWFTATGHHVLEGVPPEEWPSWVWSEKVNDPDFLTAFAALNLMRETSVEGVMPIGIAIGCAHEGYAFCEPEINRIIPNLARVRELAAAEEAPGAPLNRYTVCGYLQEDFSLAESICLEHYGPWGAILMAAEAIQDTGYTLRWTGVHRDYHPRLSDFNYANPGSLDAADMAAYALENWLLKL
jgi:hypothetical protein